MSSFVHLPDQEPCPFLPVPEVPVRPEATRRYRNGERKAPFYEAAILYAQSLWLRGFPAKALLLITRGMGADLDGGEPILRDWPLPYAAKVWLMRNRKPDQFMGNPRRHYQHLATRMSGPRAEVRTWRAWASWHLATAVFPAFPVDEQQIREEGIVIPGEDEVEVALARLGLPGEVGLWRSVLETAAPAPAHGDAGAPDPGGLRGPGS